MCEIIASTIMILDKNLQMCVFSVNRLDDVSTALCFANFLMICIAILEFHVLASLVKTFQHITITAKLCENGGDVEVR